jgi:hypothetical protein
MIDMKLFCILKHKTQSIKFGDYVLCFGTRKPCADTLNALIHLINFGNHLNILRTSLRSFVAEISAVANGIFNFFFCSGQREPVELPVFSCTQLQCFSSAGDLVAQFEAATSRSVKLHQAKRKREQFFYRQPVQR